MAQPRSRIGQEEDDVEICRVCRSGATPEQPLFHPCKCSGSMKFVHQDCLEEWLQHSRNKHCEICNHKFSFTSLYADDVPDNISFLFFLSVLFQKLSKAVTLYLRVLLAITVWLVAVPYMTAWIWRCYFSPAIVLQRTVAGRTIRTVLGGMALSGSSTAIYLNSTLPGGLEGENWHSSFQGVVADLFEGQIITAVAVIVGLALLCLKEYIVMNTPVDAEGRPVNPAPAGAELHADHVDLQARPPQAAPQPGDARAEADLNGIQREEVDSDDDNDDNIDGDNHAGDRPGEIWAPINNGQRANIPEGENVDNNAIFDIGFNVDLEFPGLAARNDVMDADGNQVDDGAGAQQLNLNINLAINNGGLAAEINANGDVNAFFVMIGVQGPLETMFYNVLLISVAIFLLIGVGVWIPYITGKTVVWVTRDVYAPVVQSGIQTTLKQIQHITDPIIDPVADAVVWGLRMLSPAHFLYGNLTESVKANISAISVNSSLEVVEPITTLTSAVVSQVKCSSTTEKIRKPIAPEEKFASLSVATTFTGTTSLGSQITAQTPRSSPTEAMSTTSVKRTFRLFGKNSPVSSSSIQPSATQSSSEPAPIIAIFEVNPLPTAVENVTVSNSTSVNATIVQGNAAANATDVEKGADHHFAKGWPRPSLRDRLTYAFVGYWTYTLGLLIHAHQQGYLEHPYAQTLNRTLIKWTRYSALGLKFTMMMVIELGLFPFFCGVLIDICTLPIFGPHATISNRIGFYFRHPWTSRFLHWLVGTTFMYQFILYIATVRAVVRKGVMWFIRDPNDNAMNEIMGRPTLVQLRKLAFGTLMYATIIVAGFGGYVVSIMGLQSFLATLGFDVNSGPLRVLPLKYEFSEPLAEFPIDLLAFHFLLPWTISLIRPMEVFQKLVRLWFRFAARRLSLSSFLFGVRYEDEEDNAVEYDDEVNDGATAGNSTDSKGKAPATADTSVLSDEPQDSAGNNDTPQPSSSSNAAEALSSSAPANADPATSTGDSNGTLEPPATTREAVDDGSGWEDESDPDSPAMREASLGPTWEQLSSRPAQPSGPRPRRQYRFMRVPNHDNIEVIPGQKIMIPIRERDPIVGRPNETQEDVAANWTKVYVPDRFRARVIALVILHWLAGLWLAVAVTVVPLYLGRFMFSSLYSFMLQSDTSTPATPPPSRGGVRPDLQVHDLYAWSLGTFTWVVLTRPLFPAIRAALRIRRRRRSEARAAARLAAVARTVRAGAGVEVLVPEKTYLQRLEEHVNAAGDLWYNWAFGRRTRDVHRGGAGDRRRRAAGGRRRVVVHRQPRGGEGDGARREGEGDVEVIDGEGEEVEEVNAGVRGDGQAARRAGGRPGVEWRRRRAAPELALEDQLMALAIVVAMWVYLIVIVGVVIPMLVGLIFELYVIQPFKGTREQTHILFLLQDWALGAVYVKVAHMLVLLGPENGFRRVVNDATNARRIGDVRMAELTRVLLAPVIGMCLVVILMPLIMGRALDKVLAVVVGQATRTLVLRYIFPFTLVLFLGYEVLGNARGWVQMWMNQVRDDVYLVGRRLHNHQDEEVRDGQRVDDEAFAVPPPPPAPPPPPPVAAGGGAAFAGRL